VTQSLRREKWDVSLRILAKVVRGIISGRREAVGRTQEPSPKKILMAKKLQFLVAAPSAQTDMKKGDLRSLGAKVHGEKCLKTAL
jgi:hypothetical protein